MPRCPSVAHHVQLQSSAPYLHQRPSSSTLHAALALVPWEQASSPDGRIERRKSNQLTARNFSWPSSQTSDLLTKRKRFSWIPGFLQTSIRFNCSLRAARSLGNFEIDALLLWSKYFGSWYPQRRHECCHAPTNIGRNFIPLEPNTPFLMPSKRPRTPELRQLSFKSSPPLKLARSYTTAVIPSSSDIEKWSSELFNGEADPKTLSKTWESWAQDERTKRWPHLLSFSLQQSPQNALVFLEISNSPSLPMWRFTRALENIAHHFLLDANTVDSKILNGIIRVSQILMPNISQETLYLLIKNVGKDEVQSLYDMVKGNLRHLTEDTSLHLVLCLAKYGFLTEANQVLKSVSASSLSPGSSKIQRVCSSFLAEIGKRENGFIESSETFTEMIRNRVKPSNHIFNTLLKSAFKHNDLEGAWQVIEMIKGRNGPDSSTYSILLNNAKLRGDIHAFTEIFRLAHREGMAMSNGHFVTDFFHGLLNFHKFLGIKRIHVYREMEYLYRGTFDIRPLQALEMISPNEEQPHPESKLPPTTAIICMMITAYFRQARGWDVIPALYKRYRLLVQQNHPVFLEMATQDFISNVFLVELCNRRKHLDLCRKVIEDMVRPLPPAITTTVSAFRTRLRQARPSQRTWALLARALGRHGNPHAAERVIKIMKAGNWNESDVAWKDYDWYFIAWNSLVKDYSRLGWAKAAVCALMQMQKEGYSVQYSTLQQLGEGIERETLLKAFESADKPFFPEEKQPRFKPDIGQEPEELSLATDPVVENLESLNGKAVSGVTPLELTVNNALDYIFGDVVPMRVRTKRVDRLIGHSPPEKIRLRTRPRGWGTKKQ